MPTILLPDAEQEGIARSVLHCLAQVPDVDVHLLSRRPGQALAFSRHVRSCRVLPEDVVGPDWAAAALAHAEALGVDAVFPIREESVGYLTRHGAPTGAPALMPLPAPAAFDVATDKAALAALMAAHGLPHPRTFAVDALRAPGGLDEPRYPVIVKRRTGAFGQDMHLAADRRALRRRLEALGDDAADYFAQEFIEGTDIDCSVICRDGDVLAHTIQRARIPSPRPFMPPDAIEFVAHEGVRSVVARLMHHLRWDGVAHVDLRMDAEGRVYVLEINARFWGSILASANAGVNFPHLALAMALGRPLPPTAYRHGPFFPRGLLGWGQRRQTDGWTWRRTHAPYVLADPAPLLVRTFRRLTA